MLDHVTVVVGNRAEVEVAVGTRDPHEAADRLLDRGVELALVKMGGEGVLVATPDEPRRRPAAPGRGRLRPRRRRRLRRRPRPRPAVRLGPGHGSPSYANAAGAIVASRLACADAMPTLDELDALVAPPRSDRMTVADDTCTERPRGPTHLRRRSGATCWSAGPPTRDAVAEAYAARQPPDAVPLRPRHPVPRRRRPPGPRRARARAATPMAMADRRSLLARLVEALAAPGRRRRARHARHRRGAAAARRARGQGRHRLDEPRRPRRRHLDDGRPVHRLRRRQHRRLPARGRQDAAAHRRPGRRHRRHDRGLRAGGQRARRRAA